jgi:Ca2+-binding RTX toxin-like protein
VDTITTLGGNDLIIGGRYGDIIDAGDGNNVVFGDSISVTASTTDGAQYAGVPITLGLVTSIQDDDGGNDCIKTGAGNDLVIGGTGDDKITAGAGNNIVAGDDVQIDWVRADRTSTPGADTNPADIDYVQSLSTAANGGIDTITTLGGNDLIIGGRYGDIIDAGEGNNVVFGDSISVTASTTDGPQYTGVPITLGLVTSIQDDDGGNDNIKTGAGNDLVIGGNGDDTINAGAGNNVVAGDDVSIDWVRADRVSVPGADTNPADIDLIESISTTANGGVDTITTLGGNDLIVGGRYGDIIDAGDGNNVVFGDSIRVSAATTDSPQYAGIAMTLGLVTSIQDDDGGDDGIKTGIGNDLVIGGNGNDTINAGAGNNIVAGDDVQIDYVRADRLATPGADTNPADIDLIESLSTTANGGVDTITTLGGNDLIIGGRYGDIINAGDGDNLVFGDSGRITAANVDAPQIAGLAMTLGLVESIEHGDGGNDQVTTGIGRDIVIGGQDNDTINAGAGNNIVAGDDVQIDYVRAERAGAVQGADTNPADIDLIESTSTTAFGGADTITTTSGDDIIIGGRFGDTIDAGDGSNIVVGDSGRITAADSDLARFATQPITLAIVETIAHGDGGSDVIHTGVGRDIILGGAAGDTVSAGAGDDIVIGDEGELLWTADSAANPATLDAIRSTDFAIGGNDTIEGNAGNDIIIGGFGADWIYGANASGVAVTGDDADVILGDNAEILGVESLANLRAAVVRTTDISNSTGGDDVILGGEDDDVIMGGIGNDTIDGGSQRDLILGDQGTLTSRPIGVNTNPRYRSLADGLLYETNGAGMGDTLVTSTWNSGPASDVPKWSNWTITVGDGLDGLFGNDYIAGGAQNDTIFGQRGNDTLMGDGSIASKLAGAPVTAYRDPVNGLVIVPSFESSTDGDDYVEGGDGNDLILGNLGQDDLIGGNSNLFGLTTVAQRNDGSDLIFGGAGTELARNNLGDTSAGGHARDADVIAGDNANIYRIVGASGAVSSAQFLNFNYDNYNTGTGPTMKITVRSVSLLDYTPGGPDVDPAALTRDRGAADEIHGEGGDDQIYGMTGNDVLFGEGQDDDLVGGWGNDWISGGTGDDGILGDDGRIFTSRNSASYGESLYGIVPLLASDPSTRTSNGNVLNEEITTPGNIQDAIVNVAGALKKTVDLTPFNVDTTGSMTQMRPKYADDILFGGLGNDFLHGGSGDDAMSGAEALPGDTATNGGWIFQYATDRTLLGAIESDYNHPVNPGDSLQYKTATGQFGAYDEYNPLKRIEEVVGGKTLSFFLNFNVADVNAPYVGTTTEGAPVYTDGNDVLFGDLGNDWIVGGSGRDHMYGGWGDDLLNADDDLSTAGGLNNVPETNSSYEDIAYGGAGRDRLIANTGGDRLIDWAGEFNSYLVPFAPFGNATVSRAIAPAIPEFLYALSEADGADQTMAGLNPSRNGEPYAEMGLVKQGDANWGDQTGAPADPQPGNIPGGARDVLRGADFNNGKLSNFAVDSGSFVVDQGALKVSASSLGGEAVAVYDVQDQLPTYFELAADVSVNKPTAGWKANAYIIFDYQNASDFKFAGLDVALNKMVIGHRDSTGWIVDKQAPFTGGIKSNTAYHMLVAINGLNATLLVNNTTVTSFTFTPRVIDGVTYDISYGYVGMGSDNSQGIWDNVKVQILPPQYSMQSAETFDDGIAQQFVASPGWTFAGTTNKTYNAPLPAGNPSISLMDLGADNLAVSSVLSLSAKVNTQGQAGFVFDKYDDSTYKFAVIDVAQDKVIIGHRTARTGWVTDATWSMALDAGVTYTLGLSLAESTVNVSVNGASVVGYSYNAAVVDGRFGLMAVSGATSFDDVGVKTTDPGATVSVTNDLAAQSPATAMTGVSISDADLAPLVAEAKRRLAPELTAEQQAAMDSAVVKVTDLGWLALGATDEQDGVIWIDADAAGYGWFVDATPADDAEFRMQDATLLAVSDQAVGRMDLLSVITHELGHAAGLEHTAGGVMQPTLEAGERTIAAVQGTLLPVAPAPAVFTVPADAAAPAAVADALAPVAPDAPALQPLGAVEIRWDAVVPSAPVTASGSANWMADFANNLGETQEERNAASKLRVDVPRAASKVLSSAVSRISKLFGG